MHYRRAEELTKLEYGAYLAAGLAALMLRQRDAVGLLAFDEEVHTGLRPRATPAYLRRLLAHLERLTRADEADAPKRTGAADALAEVAERIHRRSLVVLVTDLFENVGRHDDLLKALRRLRHRGHEVVVFHVLEGATERRFDFPNAPMVFQDTETGAEVTLQPQQVREHYQEAARHFSERFRRRCLEHDIDFAELDTGTPYDEALMTYLNKRQRLV
jgi:uncharacterized protein (DUF58 family)